MANPTRPFDDTRFAVIADIHGNVDALAAVLDDIATQRVGAIVNLGDHLSGPMDARGTAATLMAQDIVCIRGNHDRWIIDPDDPSRSEIDRIAFDQLDDAQLDWLRALPPTATLSDSIFACHGTPRSDTTYWLEHVTADGDLVLRDADEILGEAAGIDATLYLCGHTHLPRRVDLSEGRIVLNPGSVGCPGYVDDAPVLHAVQSGTGAACYAIVERTPRGWASSFRHVPYDPRRMIEMSRDAGLPNWVPRLESGRVGAWRDG